MHESYEPYYEEEGIFEAINRYEEMVRKNHTQFFDLCDFENIIDYYIDKQNFKEAHQAIDYSITQHPYASSLKFRLAQVYIQSGKPTRGIRLLKEIEHFEYQSSDYHLMVGVASNLLGKKEEARSAFDKAIHFANDDRDDVIFNIAYAYMNTRRFRLAIHYLKLALEINPQNLSAIYELAMIYERLERLEEAIQCYKNYLDVEPFAYNIWINLGMNYTNLGQFDNAIDAYDYALAIDPQLTPALFSKANTLINAKRISDAIDVYSEILEFEAENIQAYCFIGECYEKLGQFKHALAFYKSALLVDNSYAEAWYGMGMTNYHLKNYDEAIRCFQAACEIDPESSDYWFMVGETFLLTEQNNKAISSFRRVVELDPNDYEAWVNLSELIHKTLGLNEAIALAQKAHRLNKDSAALCYQLSLLYAYSDDKLHASDYFLKGLELDYTEHKEFIKSFRSTGMYHAMKTLANKFSKR